MNNDVTDKDDCASFFCSIGLSAIEIPETPGLARTPDLHINSACPPYLVEIKTRRSSEGWVQDLSSKGSATSQATWGAIGWPFKAAQDALDQFLSFDPHHDNLWVLWLPIRREQDQDTAFEQVMDSFLGVRHFIADLGRGELLSKPCIDAQQSVFERCREIDFAIVSSGANISPFLNERGNRVEVCRSSALYDAFVGQGKVNSVSSLVEGGWWVYDGKAGASQQEIAEYLQEKYKIAKVLPSEMATHSVTSRLARKEEL